jgi:hypothetical protein
MIRSFGFEYPSYSPAMPKSQKTSFLFSKMLIPLYEVRALPLYCHASSLLINAYTSSVHLYFRGLLSGGSRLSQGDTKGLYGRPTSDGERRLTRPPILPLVPMYRPQLPSKVMRLRFWLVTSPFGDRICTYSGRILKP